MMAAIDGDWDCTTRTPMGDQRMGLTIASDGGAFTGSVGGDLGIIEIAGSVDGDSLTWKMDIRSPFPLTLDCSATVTGDTIEGSVTAGAFGSFPLAGTRRS
jgi:hypothetical protein